jgi:hypothetical protein
MPGKPEVSLGRTPDNEAVVTAEPEPAALVGTADHFQYDLNRALITGCSLRIPLGRTLPNQLARPISPGAPRFRLLSSARPKECLIDQLGVAREPCFVLGGRRAVAASGSIVDVQQEKFKKQFRAARFRRVGQVLLDAGPSCGSPSVFETIADRIKP